MAYVIRTFHSFERRLKSICKKYPGSEREIRSAVKTLAKNPEQGFAYPGFNPFEVRKTRIALKAYKMSASRGLRLIFLHLPDREIVAPLIIYKKGRPQAEHEIKKMVLTALQDVATELTD